MMIGCVYWFYSCMSPPKIKFSLKYFHTVEEREKEVLNKLSTFIYIPHNFFSILKIIKRYLLTGDKKPSFKFTYSSLNSVYDVLIHGSINIKIDFIKLVFPKLE